MTKYKFCYTQIYDIITVEINKSCGGRESTRELDTMEFAPLAKVCGKSFFSLLLPLPFTFRFLFTFFLNFNFFLILVVIYYLFRFTCSCLSLFPVCSQILARSEKQKSNEKQTLSGKRKGKQRNEKVYVLSSLET